MDNKIYLGDSVYAEFDGFGILLTTQNGKPTDPSNSIYLEPSIIENLNAFVNAIKQRNLEKIND